MREDPVAHGTRLQLAIYALAARGFLRCEGPVIGRYWLTSSGRSEDSIACELTEELTARLRDVVSMIVDGIEAGVFPGVPGEETYRVDRPTFENCAYCDFDRVCPADRERRWTTAMSTPEVVPLTSLRSDPPASVAGLVTPRPLDLNDGGPT
jgi:ATP-dependent helicase/nuclease subunit B